MDFEDIIEELLEQIVAAETTDMLSKIGPIVLSLLVAFAMGMLIYFIYTKAFRGVIFNHNFALSLPLMVTLTTIVTLAISSNIALSLGMVGALSIVRYRAAIKDPMDLLFLFWSVTTGITVGANMHYLAVIGAIISIIIILIINHYEPSVTKYILIVHYSGTGIDDELKRILHKRKYKIRAKTLRKEDTEMVVEIVVRNENLSFVDALREQPEVTDVSLVEYSMEFHG